MKASIRQICLFLVFAGILCFSTLAFSQNPPSSQTQRTMPKKPAADPCEEPTPGLSGRPINQAQIAAVQSQIAKKQGRIKWLQGDIERLKKRLEIVMAKGDLKLTIQEQKDEKEYIDADVKQRKTKIDYRGMQQHLDAMITRVKTKAQNAAVGPRFGGALTPEEMAARTNDIFRSEQGALDHMNDMLLQGAKDDNLNRLDEIKRLRAKKRGLIKKKENETKERRDRKVEMFYIKGRIKQHEFEIKQLEEAIRNLKVPPERYDPERTERLTGNILYLDWQRALLPVLPEKNHYPIIAQKFPQSRLLMYEEMYFNEILAGGGAFFASIKRDPSLGLTLSHTTGSKILHGAGMTSFGLDVIAHALRFGINLNDRNATRTLLEQEQNKGMKTPLVFKKPGC